MQESRRKIGPAKFKKKLHKLFNAEIQRPEGKHCKSWWDAYCSVTMKAQIQLLLILALQGFKTCHEVQNQDQRNQLFCLVLMLL